MNWKPLGSREDLDRQELDESCKVNEFEAHKLIHVIAGSGYREVTRSCYNAMQDGLRRTDWDIDRIKIWFLEQINTEIGRWIILACIHDLRNIQAKAK